MRLLLFVFLVGCAAHSNQTIVEHTFNVDKVTLEAATLEAYEKAEQVCGDGKFRLLGSEEKQKDNDKQPTRVTIKIGCLK